MNLFAPLVQRGVTLKNRIVVSPMCQYSAQDGVPNQWHLVHLGSRAVGGAGAVIAEASAVQAGGRISPGDTGLWNDAQVAAWSPITSFIREAGAVAGVQLAHAGRKASCAAPWDGGRAVAPEQGGWLPIVAPSALAFDEHSIVPQALDGVGIDALVADFAAAAQRALAAGFELVEIHAAHGYLLHEFLSPLSNHRDDDYGGSFDNRIRLLRRVIAAVRAVWPERLPLWLRISATDWADPQTDGAGWDLDQSCALVEAIKGDGVDLIDVSSGGTLPRAKIPVGAGFQTPLAATIRERCDVATGAVGMITAPAQADHVIRTGQADVVLLAREMLRDPYWPRRAALELRQTPDAPVQYQRAW
ncbi:NADH:flavin oxidoreductase/NADH oxidase [Solimonas marina]|uniref:NADH:flavin oxidoreductase/NADH oxidase n=1 Tax=Solimonas marina TaxID=2714601 RepID=A0A969W571_9GAMM|nr:NADH:flavin oxidoreductase/NADH oxidase [Solimonas marina]NKF20792.1 NADH:flavin oxidoreductase/NADH oxidase [Solimonas marina]